MVPEPIHPERSNSRLKPEVLMFIFSEEIVSPHLKKITKYKDLETLPYITSGVKTPREAALEVERKEFMKKPLIPENARDRKENEAISSPKPLPRYFNHVINPIFDIVGIPNYDQVFNADVLLNPIRRRIRELASKYRLYEFLPDGESPQTFASAEQVGEKLKKCHPVWKRAYDTYMTDVKDVEMTNKEFKVWKRKNVKKNLKEFEEVCKVESLYFPGSHGENILHKLVLWLITSDNEREKEAFFDYIKFILKDPDHRRRLINSQYEGKEYYGETVLHLALAARSKWADDEDEVADIGSDASGSAKNTKKKKYVLNELDAEVIKYLTKRKYEGAPERKDLEKLIENKVPVGQKRKLSIENRLLIYLLRQGADPHVHIANGNFFSTESAQYIAGSVLGMASRLGNRFAMELLLSFSRADPDMTDTKGNTPLHVLAWFGIHDWETALSQELSIPFHGMYQNNREGIQAVNREIQLRCRTMEGPWTVLRDKGAFRNQKNRRYQTPFILALYKKHSTTASLILEDIKIQRWLWGGTSGALYDVNAIEPLGHDRPTIPDRVIFAYTETKKLLFGGKFNEDWNRKEATHNAIEIIVRNEDYRSLLMIPIIQILLEAKWIHYARGMYWVNFMATLAYMLLFSVYLFVFLPKSHTEPAGIDTLGMKRMTYSSVRDDFRGVAEIILVAGTCTSLLIKFVELIRYGVTSFFWTGLNYLQNLLLMVWYSLSIIQVIFRVKQLPDYENIVLSLLSIIGWSRILHYLQGVRQVGPLVNIFIFIVWENFLKRFIWIYAIVYFAFGQAIWLQMTELSDPPTPEVNEMLNQTLTGSGESREKALRWLNPLTGFLYIWSYQVDQNDNQFPIFEYAKNREVAIILYSLYIFLAFVLLINMLIAMLSNTFTNTAEYSDRVWMLRWARFVLEMEKQVSYKLLLRYRATIGMPVDVIVYPKEETIEPEDITNRGRFFWVQTVQSKQGHNIPMKIVTNEVEEYDVGMKVLENAGKRFVSETWQNAVDERKFREIENVVGGKRISP
ncbi:Transient receptor putative cation channel sub V member 4 [Nowakowskiella sp. JEL0407]|nr:Transient receptor putative cation channel sub V member 4 [Nowakowskiella sp. JEL0407]